MTHNRKENENALTAWKWLVQKIWSGVVWSVKTVQMEEERSRWWDEFVKQASFKQVMKTERVIVLLLVEQ